MLSSKWVTLLFVIACGRDAAAPFEYRAIRMGTEMRIRVHASDEPEAAAAAALAFHRVAELDSLLSDYRTDSEVEAVAAAAGRAPVRISRELADVLAAALRLARETDGAFDPTVGPMTVLWREARRTGERPDSVALAAARDLVAWRDVELDTVRRSLRLSRPGMRLDLGGIAKGYAADAALRVMRGHGFTRVLVVFGGEIVAGDAPPGQAGWTVRSEVRPDSSFVLLNNALSASGDAEQFILIDGQRYSHVIDPGTGRGLSTNETATVLAPDGMTADALATAVTLLADDRRAGFVARHDEAMFFFHHR
jgi:thiamine biosynthesis lipoprotein